jgi:hypothetical protein
MIMANCRINFINLPSPLTKMHLDNGASGQLVIFEITH